MKYQTKRAAASTGSGSIQDVLLGGSDVRKFNQGIKLAQEKINNPNAAEIALLRELARIYDRLGNPASAQRCFDKANGVR